ncbi:MAG: ThuA domain-containing protein [Fimbriimonadaceae bacterium]|nr:ThuA domain-containing protein [Fimbriimonadaceae bacterium]
MPNALICWGGWDGHEPDKVAAHFQNILKAEGFTVEVQNGLGGVEAPGRLMEVDLFIPIITMSDITGEQSTAICGAVAEGMPFAGCHGGMCDSFRQNTEWQFMTGGQWVAHPGNDGVAYQVEIVPGLDHPITRGMADFTVVSEQYYLHVDPGVKTLAFTRFPLEGVDGPHVENPCAMPQVWTKMYGKGRVFYNALGHNRAVFDIPEATELMRRGFLWATGRL